MMRRLCLIIIAPTTFGFMLAVGGTVLDNKNARRGLGREFSLDRGLDKGVPGLQCMQRQCNNNNGTITSDGNKTANDASVGQTLQNWDAGLQNLAALRSCARARSMTLENAGPHHSKSSTPAPSPASAALAAPPPTADLPAAPAAASSCCSSARMRL